MQGLLFPSHGPYLLQKFSRINVCPTRDLKRAVGIISKATALHPENMRGLSHNLQTCGSLAAANTTASRVPVQISTTSYTVSQTLRTGLSSISQTSAQVSVSFPFSNFHTFHCTIVPLWKHAVCYSSRSSTKGSLEQSSEGLHTLRSRVALLVTSRSSAVNIHIFYGGVWSAFRGYCLLISSGITDIVQCWIFSVEKHPQFKTFAFISLDIWPFRILLGTGWNFSLFQSKSFAPEDKICSGTERVYMCSWIQYISQIFCHVLQVIIFVRFIVDQIIILIPFKRVEDS